MRIKSLDWVAQTSDFARLLLSKGQHTLHILELRISGNFSRVPKESAPFDLRPRQNRNRVTVRAVAAKLHSSGKRDFEE